MAPKDKAGHNMTRSNLGLWVGMASADDALVDAILKRRGLGFSSLLQSSIGWVVPDPSGRDKTRRSSGNNND